MLDKDTLRRLRFDWEEGERHDAAAPTRAEKRLNITLDTGKFLYQLARAARAEEILEIGTSNGYSAVWLALALAGRAGRLRSADLSADKQRQAAATLAGYGVADRVELLCADAGALLRKMDDASVDFIFLDADRSRYVGYWPDLARILRSGGLLVMDNALSHPAECADFIGLALASEGYLAETYGIGKGQFVIVKD
ncbi:methyltransferase [Xenophilus sp. AP218F]|nr:class I SAM-dependent methyltransferase [Chromobacterium sp. ASV5]OWY40216.1 methyltransferase [Xenophilus sp. AP218F]